MPGHIDRHSNTEFEDLKIYFDIFLNLNAIIVIHDFKGKILKVNNKFLETFGYSYSDISTLTVKDLLPKESHSLFQKVIDDTLSQGSANHEVTIKKKLQETFPAHVYTSILEIGGTKLVQCVLYDITEQKNIETKLRETNLFLDSIIENIPDMIFLKDAEELRFVRINKAGEKMLGYSRKKLLGKNDYDFFSKKEADFFTAKDRDALKTGESINIPEEQINIKAKGTRTLHTKKISIHDEQGEPKYLLGISEDITERKQAQEWFKLIVESSPSAIVVIGQDNKIKLINSRAEEIFGYDRLELLGKQVEILMPKHTRGQHAKHRKKFADDPKPRRMGAGRDLIARRKDGSEFPVEIGLSPIHTKDSLMTIALIVDITKRKQAEEVLRKSHEELEKAVSKRTADLSLLNKQLHSEVDIRRKAEEELEENVGQLSRKNRYEEIINTVTRSVHSSLDLDKVLNNSVNAMHENIDHAENVGIFFVEGDYAVNKANRGYSKELLKKVKKIPHPKGFTWKTILEGKFLYCNDAEADTIIGPAGKKEGTKSYACMPIKLKDKTIGCININSFQKNAFDNEDLKLLDIVAQQIGVAINNANQAEALKHSRDEISKNLQELSRKNRYEEIVSTVTKAVHKSVELEEVLENAVEVMSKNIDVVDHVSIYFVEDKDAVRKSHRGYPNWFLKKISRIPYPKGFTWDCINKGKVIFCPDAQADGVIGPAGKKVGTKSYVAIPIKDRGKTIGSINVHSLQKNAFDKDDLSLLEVVAKQIEISINQSRDAEALRNSEERYRTLYQEGPSMYFTVNEDGSVLSVNHNGIEKLGYSQEELIGHSVYSVFLEEDKAKIKEQLSKCFANPNQIFRWELRKVCKNGSVIPVSELARCVIDPDGNKVALIACEDITERIDSEQKLQSAFSEIELLKDKLEKENVYLKKEIELNYSHADIIGESKAIKKALNKIEQVAETDSTVMLTGETGTGKERFADRIHSLSRHKDRVMVKVNCAALPPHLIESELFGHEKGAFTGAVTKNIGRFEIADDSTLFLDEVAELPLELQSKLLRALQEGEFQRVGSSKTIKVNVRVIAASNNQLLEAVNMGKFREDLYYRLNVFPVNIPPLRERKEDITDLLWFFISEFEEKMQKTIKNISRKDMENLINYPWPGNVRQLRNVIERAMIISSGPDLQIELPGISRERVRSEIKEMEEVERDHISYILNMTNWRIRGKSGAAEILGLKPTTLESRIKKLGIKRGH